MAATLIGDALAILRDKYIFPDRAEEAARAIEARLAAGEYEGLTEEQLCERLTAELFAVCADRHLRIRIRHADLQAVGETEEDAEAVWAEQQRLGNYGIARAERLDGNIGYLDLRCVTSPGIGGRAIAAAMELVCHTGALIIDLRKNRGGDPNGVQMWNSYLFADAETHLNSIYFGATKNTRDFWTLAHLPGERYLNPVFLLTSASTFSAGEEFSYNLKNLKRATLIGETTRGGAHPTDRFPVSRTVEITVPVARSINPVTGTNWEGVGVDPDLATPADAAFDVAYRMALEHVLTTATGDVRDEATVALTTRTGD